MVGDRHKQDGWGQAQAGWLGSDLSRQQEAGGVGAKESKEGTEVEEELEDMKVLLVLRVCQALVCPCHRSIAQSHLQQTWH